MLIAVVIPFLNEERYLADVLDGIATQVRRPDELLLVDDGSTDGSPAVAARFAKRFPWARVLHRPPRAREADRMVRAHELRAFQWGVDRLEVAWAVVAKLDADVKLSPDALAAVERRFGADAALGIAGTYLAEIGADGRPARHRCPRDHVEGATAFYRRECWDQIQPLPPILGWDTIDEVRARMRGWRTQSFPVPSGDPLHLRRTGSHDGVLRGFRRAGLAAYAYGAHPLHVLAAAAARLAERPRGLCSVHYLAGWALAALRRVPRAEREARLFVRRENTSRLRRVVTGGFRA
jgi:poly-beta-1,6-N-acetyl-D-glucosamine synthase